MAEINDYLNSLNEAMAIHAKNAIKNLQFNKTELCTIVNETRAEQNIYIVWNGSSRYEAYSTTDMKYHIDDRVYVNIPNNDFSQKKYIIGPYVDGDAENLLYVSPFSNFTSSKINLINIAEKNEGKGLIEFAYDKEGIKKFVKCELALGDKIELTIPKEEIDQLNKGYKYIAISADFMTDFGNEKVISGDYGIEVHADYEKEVETLKDPVTDKKVYTLTKKDMIGDIYNFKTYFTQKALYELEKDDNPIEGITIVLYADDNFKTADLKAVESGKIYIANIEITLGDPSAKNEDVIKIYTNNGNNYDSRAEKLKNQKTIHFKWQDYDDENEITYNYDEENKNKDIKIHWYEDKAHSPGEDTKALTDEVWKNYLDAAEDNKKNLIQDVISYYQLVENKHYIKNDDGEINITSAGEREIDRMIKYSTGENVIVSDTLAGVGWSLIEDNYNKWSITFDPDITKNSCKVKVIITDKNDEKIGESNELEFKNTIQVADPATVAKIAGLKIKFTDGSKGNYPIYSGNTGEILSKSEINKTRKLKLELNDPIDGKSYFTGNEIIIWKIPKNNLSMIYILENFYEGKTLYSNEGNLKEKELKERIDTLDDITELLNDFNNYYYIVEESNEKEPEQQYGINNFYNKLNVNNTIFCYVIKNKVLYSTNVSLTFSQYGTSGSEYTFYLGLGNIIKDGKEEAPKSIITMGKPDVKYKIDAKLLNTAGDVLNVDIKLSWYNKPAELELGTDNTVRTTTSKDLNGYKKAIIQATTNYGGINFTQLLPIHVGSSDIAYYDGPDRIIYDDTGKNPTTYSKPLILYLNNNNSITSGFTLNTKYQAYIDDKNYLIPANMYYSDNKQPYIITYEKDETKFTCPLLVLQSRYDIPIINEWDGSLKVDGDTNSILAASVIAGTKTNNTFTGLLMGQINKPKSIPSIDTGLFGYQKGIQTFRLGTDGELTLGSSGQGQIKLNGTSGVIEGSGMRINLTKNQESIVFKNNDKEKEEIFFELKSIYNGDKPIGAEFNSTGKINIKGAKGSEIYFGDNDNYIKMGLDKEEKPYINSNLFKIGSAGNEIGGVTISNNGLSGAGWGVSPSTGFYTTKGYEYVTGDKTYYNNTFDPEDLLDYIETRIKAGTETKEFTELILKDFDKKTGDSVTKRGKMPKITYSGYTTFNPSSQSIPTPWDDSPAESLQDYVFNYFMYNFTIGSENEKEDGKSHWNIKDFVWWCIDLWIKKHGGSGLDGTSEGVGREGNEGKHLFRQDEETGLDIIESEQDIQWDIVRGWNTSTKNNTYSPSMYTNNPGPWKNCTWSAWELFFYFTGHELPMWGNAIDWYAKAQADPAYETGLTPPNGKPSILVLRSSENAWGHVAVVIKRYNNEDGTWNEHIDSVEGNYITNSEPGFRLMINNTPLFGRKNKTVEGYIWLKDTNTQLDGEEGD